MHHAELHLQSERPSLIKTGITPLFCVQYLLDGFFSSRGEFYTRVASIYSHVFIFPAQWLQQGLNKLQQEVWKTDLSVAWFWKSSDA